MCDPGSHVNRGGLYRSIVKVVLSSGVGAFVGLGLASSGRGAWNTCTAALPYRGLSFPLLTIPSGAGAEVRSFSGGLVRSCYCGRRLSEGSVLFCFLRRRAGVL